MSCKIAGVIAILEELAPPQYAEDWDNVGLLVGSRQAETGAVLVALDCTREVLDEAVEAGAALVVCHHPPIFRPLKRLLADDPVGLLLHRAVAAGVSVYAAHTNLDASEVGVNTVLAEILGLTDLSALQRAPERRRNKLVTFLPPDHVAAVSAALFSAGAGRIGDYAGCSFRLEGAGTFTPGPDSHPAYGEKGGPNEVREVRLEVVVEEKDLARTLEALLLSHPYEEPAYDVYPLRDFSPAGLGRVGNLPRPLSLADLALRCSRELANPAVRVAGDPALGITRVAVCGGSGGKLARAAVRAGAQALVTGDVGYHDALEAAGLGLAVIDAGHYHTERPAMQRLARLLEEGMERAGLEAPVRLSEIRTDPWSWGGGM